MPDNATNTPGGDAGEVVGTPPTAPLPNRTSDARPTPLGRAVRRLRAVGGVLGATAADRLPEHWLRQGPSRWSDDVEFEASRTRLEARARRGGRPLVLAELYCRSAAAARLTARVLERRARVTDVLCRSSRPSAVARAGGVVILVLLPDSDEAGAVPLLNAVAEALPADERPTVSLRVLPQPTEPASMPVAERGGDEAVHSAA